MDGIRKIKPVMYIIFSVLGIVTAIYLTLVSFSNVSDPTPPYRIVSNKHCDLGPVRRLQVKISVPAYYTRDQIEHIAKDAVQRITRLQRVNAINILFYGPRTNSFDGLADLARVIWAPNGRWTDAMYVQAGDYSTFQYQITYWPPNKE